MSGTDALGDFVGMEATWTTKAQGTRQSRPWTLRTAVVSYRQTQRCRFTLSLPDGPSRPAAPPLAVSHAA